MATPTSTITLTNVKNTINEGISTNYSAVAAITFNDTLVRKLAGRTTDRSSISMNDMRGKAGPTPVGTVISSYCTGSTLTVVTADGRYSTTTTNTPNSNSCRATIVGGSGTISSNQTNYTVNVSTLSGYIAGRSDITITVNSGVYVYATATTNAGLTITGATAGDTIRLINYGYIMGKGGDGGGLRPTYTAGASTAGGPALSINYPITIDNTNASAYIGGGGGGGGAGYSASPGGNMGSGGGGAGGGAGGSLTGFASAYTAPGGAGGGPGQAGGNGTTNGASLPIGTPSGGGGGRIFPGVGGPAVVANSSSPYSKPGLGGGAGGSGGCGQTTGISSGAGGSANGLGGNPNVGRGGAGGGGGGWGAKGGDGVAVGGTTANNRSFGSAGGKAVNTNGGNSVTWVNGNIARVYGAVG